jgi:hypothetical protein
MFNAFFIGNSTLLLIVLTAWVLPWKGVALWRAARLRDKWWFIAVLVLNTVGILDIIYFYFISKRKSLSQNREEIA